MRDLIDMVSEGITDHWFKTDSFETYKKELEHCIKEK